MPLAERSYRSLLVSALAAGAVMLLPLTFTFFPSALPQQLHALDAFVAFCTGVLDALQLQLPPLGVVVLALIGISVGSVAVRAILLVVHTRRSCGASSVEPPPSRLRRASARVGVQGAVHYVGDARPMAYCIGLIRPGIVISEGALRRLRDDELEAVLWHEAEHLRRHDPLRVFIAHALAALFIALPLIEWLRLRFELAKELDADRAALRALGDPAPLAGALLALGAQGAPGSLAIGAWSLTAVRIDQLSGATTEHLMPRPGRVAVVATALSLALALGLAMGQGARAHALPAPPPWPGHAQVGSTCPLPTEGILL